MDFDSLSKLRSGLGTAAVIVMDKSTDIVRAIARISHFYKHESCGQCTPCREGSGWMLKSLERIERGDATSGDLDLLLEVAGSMGLTSGTTICGLADGNNWAVRTIVNKFRGEFEARVKPQYVPVYVTAGGH